MHILGGNVVGSNLPEIHIVQRPQTVFGEFLNLY